MYQSHRRNGGTRLRSRFSGGRQYDRFGWRRDGGYSLHRGSGRQGNYYGESEEYGIEDTFTGKVLKKVTAKKAGTAAHAVVCEKCTFDSCRRSGKYYNLRTGEEVVFGDPDQKE